MKLIFDWSDSFYEEKQNWRSDEEIISLEIFQKEFGFAVAKISLGAKNTDRFLNKKYAKIGLKEKDNETKIIFSGRLVAFPVGFGSSIIELELISEPDDYQIKLSKFSNEKMEQYFLSDKHVINENGFDDLFFSSRDLQNPTIFLEGNNKIFYWNMKNGELSLSDINCGEKNFDISGDEILQDSIKVRISREPYKIVNLKVSASWIQHEYGILDIFPMIAAKFERHLVNSFTNIKSGIEKFFCEKSGGYKSSGYKLNCCNIKEINPNANNPTKNHPLSSPVFYIQQSDNKQKIIFKRFYFDGKLIIDWSYKQKRVEVVNVKINNESSSKYGREKNLYLRLNEIQLPKTYPRWNHFIYYGYGDKIQHKDSIWECVSSHVSNKIFEEDKWQFVQKIPDALKDETCSSFFSTDRGKNALKYAMQKAIALINYSSRYVEIDFCVGAKDFIHANINDQITIHDLRFKNGYIVGKITKMRFIGSADKKIIQFTIGCSDIDPSRNFEKLNSYKIAISEDEKRINPADIVKKIEIKNSPEEQLEILAHSNAQSSSELENELKKHATKIKLSLHPLNTTRVITREINLPDIILENNV